MVGKPAELKKLESIVHPLVATLREDFLRQAEASGAAMAVLEIQMLLEGSSAKHLDVIVVVSAPADIQRARALARPGMTEDKLAGILSNQMPDAEKRARADFVVDTGKGVEHAREQVRRILADIAKMPKRN